MPMNLNKCHILHLGKSISGGDIQLTRSLFKKKSIEGFRSMGGYRGVRFWGGGGARPPAFNEIPKLGGGPLSVFGKV